jgi:Fe2+ transport system protein B
LFLRAVGNKDDNFERKVVQSADARRLADQIGVPFVETSAKENKNIEEVGRLVFHLLKQVPKRIRI